MAANSIQNDLPGAMLPGDDVEAAVGYLTASFGSNHPASRQ
jgi:hypothetical protein